MPAVSGAGFTAYSPGWPPGAPLLAGAAWQVDASENGSGPVMVDLAGGLTSTAPVPNAKILTPASFTGSMLVGRLTLTGGTVAAEWPAAELDVVFDAVVLPHHANNPAGNWAEVLNIPVDGTDNVNDWLEPAFVLRDDGTIRVGQDWDSGSETGPGTWESATVGTWDAGIAEAVWRQTITAAGAATLYKDGVSVDTAALGASTFPEPPAGTVVNVGPIQYAVFVRSFELRASIGGAVLLSFDAADTTGWEGFANAGGAVTTAPSRPSWYLREAHTFTDPAVFDIGAGDSATWAFSGRLLAPGGQTWWSRNQADFVTAAAWQFFHSPGFGFPNAFAITDASGVASVVSAAFGTLTTDDVVQVAVLDRTAGELRTYVDGALVTTADASGLGACSPDADVLVGGVTCYGAGAAFWDRALTAAEIAAVSQAMA